MKLLDWGSRAGRGEQYKAKKTGKTPGRRDMLQLRPVRNPALEWYEEDGHVVLHIKRISNWKTKLLHLLIPLPDERRIVLDAIGTDVWRMSDGETTVGRIIKALAGKYKLTPREVELSLQQFFKELGRRGYVAFAMPTDDESTATRDSL